MARRRRSPVTAIRQLAASHSGHVLAAAEFERFVHLWDLRTRRPLRSIDTILDFGGKRLAITNDGRTVAVGAYHIHGIAAYSGRNGSELWRRKDLKKAQQISFTSDGSRLLCCFDACPCERLSILNGRSAIPLRGVRRVWESPLKPIRLEERSRDYRLVNRRGALATIPRRSFAILCAAFSDRAFCVSEAGGPVRCFSIPSGEELWRHDPPRGVHFLRIAFAGARRFVGVSFPFERGGPLLLHSFDPQSGAAVPIADVGSSTELAFCLAGSRLVNDSGSIFDVPSGRLIGTLPFPTQPSAK